MPGARTVAELRKSPSQTHLPGAIRAGHNSMLNEYRNLPFLLYRLDHEHRTVPSAYPKAAVQDLRRRLARTRSPNEIPGTGWESVSISTSCGGSVTIGESNSTGKLSWKSCPSFTDYRGRSMASALTSFTSAAADHRPCLWFLPTDGRAPLSRCSKNYSGADGPGELRRGSRGLFDVVVPSLPGFGFSDRPTEPGMNTWCIAEFSGVDDRAGV